MMGRMIFKMYQSGDNIFDSHKFCKNLINECLNLKAGIFFINKSFSFARKISISRKTRPPFIELHYTYIMI